MMMMASYSGFSIILLLYMGAGYNRRSINLSWFAPCVLAVVTLIIIRCSYRSFISMNAGKVIWEIQHRFVSDVNLWYWTVFMFAIWSLTYLLENSVVVRALDHLVDWLTEWTFHPQSRIGRGPFKKKRLPGWISDRLKAVFENQSIW